MSTRKAVGLVGGMGTVGTRTYERVFRQMGARIKIIDAGIDRNKPHVLWANKVDNAVVALRNQGFVCGSIACFSWHRWAASFFASKHMCFVDARQVLPKAVRPGEKVGIISAALGGPFFDTALRALGACPQLLSVRDQLKLDKSIHARLAWEEKMNSADRLFLTRVVKRLLRADSRVLVGCTDLSEVIRQIVPEHQHYQIIDVPVLHAKALAELAV